MIKTLNEALQLGRPWSKNTAEKFRAMAETVDCWEALQRSERAQGDTVGALFLLTCCGLRLDQHRQHLEWITRELRRILDSETI